MSVREPGDDLRDPHVDAAWKSLPDAAPPAALDDAIRAAARRAVHAQPTRMKSRAPWPAWMSLAAAACIGVVAVGVWQMQPQDINPIQAPVSDMVAKPTAGSEQRASSKPSVSTPMVQEDSAPAQPALRKDRPSAPAAMARNQDAEVAQDRMIASPRATKPADSAAQPALPDAMPRRDAPLRAPSPFPGTSPPEPDNLALAPPRSAQADKAEVANAPSPPSAPPNAMAGGGLKQQRSDDARMRDEVSTARASPGISPLPPVAPAVAPAPVVSGFVAAPAVPPTAPLAKKATRSFDDYIDVIRRALQEHREEDAARELAALRSAYPDADQRMPVDLRAFALRVRH